MPGSGRLQEKLLKNFSNDKLHLNQYKKASHKARNIIKVRKLTSINL